MYDVAIIGAGVTGSSHQARELSRYQLNVCVIEREEDVCAAHPRPTVPLFMRVLMLYRHIKGKGQCQRQCHDGSDCKRVGYSV